MQGLFLTFEGIDFCGKSTQAKRLVTRLESMSVPVVVVREPGGTHISEAVREILLDNKHQQMDARTELLLYTAARAQIVAEKIFPALEASQVVICDRFIDSTTAYQGYGRLLDLDFVHAVNRFATKNVKLSCTIFLDIPVEIAEARRKEYSLIKDRLEDETIPFHQRVRDGYLQIAQNEPERFCVVNGEGSIEQVAQRVWDVVGRRLVQGQTK
ncbi:MAG: dTMP kinase [bacterium]